MIVKYKLDKAFGPAGSAAGIFVLAMGLFALYYSPGGWFIVVLGSWLGFSSTCTFVDFEKKRIKFSNNIFGILPLGKWTKLEPHMKIGARKSGYKWRSYGEVLQTYDLLEDDFRIFLFDANSIPIFPIRKLKSKEAAKAELTQMSEKLGLEIIT